MISGTWQWWPCYLFILIQGIYGDPRIACDSVSMTVYLNKSYLAAGTTPGDLHFADENCVGVEQNDFEIMLYTRYDMCQTNSEQTETAIVYTNAVTYSYMTAVPNTDITRHKGDLLVNIRCELDKYQLLNRFFNPRSTSVIVDEEGYGNFTLTLDRYSSESFGEHVTDLETSVSLGERLFFAVNLTTTPGLTVFIENCWSTPSPDPLDPKKYNLIDDGCKSDSTVEMYDSLGPTLKAFSLDAFTFIGDYQQVYIHCDAVVCFEDDDESLCAEGCIQGISTAGDRSRREASQRLGRSSLPHVVSQGPVYFSKRSAGYSSDKRSFTTTTGFIIGSVTGLTCFVIGIISVLAIQLYRRGRTTENI